MYMFFLNPTNLPAKILEWSVFLFSSSGVSTLLPTLVIVQPKKVLSVRPAGAPLCGLDVATKGAERPSSFK